MQEGLNSISPSVSDVVLFYLQKNAAVRPEEHVIDPEAFDDGLKNIFGCGAKIIEKIILELLYYKLDNPQKIHGDFNFAEEVKKAQKLLGCDDLLVAENLQ